MTAYYNENDPRAAAWIRELIAARQIPAGDVDERSIEDVTAGDVRGYTQCHFFAGIGGWAYALALAEWPADRPVWTGSCPCQPFSSAGKQSGFADERHLWPALHWLIAQCRPATVFGEQVASALGREWLARVFADLEALGYAAAGADLCAASVGAPHIRQRLYWIADANMSNEHTWASGRQQPFRLQCDPSVSELGDAAFAGLQGQWSEYCPSGEGCSGFTGLAMQAGVPQWNGSTIALKCSDGSRRASAESGAFPLAYGLPARMGRLLGYGNAIVPQVAAEVIGAYMEAA